MLHRIVNTGIVYNTDSLKRLDENYFENLEENNGDFDLENLNENGRPIFLMFEET